MSVRIYELSKDLGIDNAELINLLKERGYQVKSASSTIDNISAESLRQEFGNRGGASVATAPDESEAPSDAPAPTDDASGAVIRSKEDIERERREREEEEKRNAAPRVPVPPAKASAPPALKAPPPLPRPPAPSPRPEGTRPPMATPAPRPNPGPPVVRTDLPPPPPPAPEPPPAARPPASPVVSAPRVALPRPGTPQGVRPPAAVPPPVSRPTTPPPLTPKGPPPPPQPETEESAPAVAATPPVPANLRRLTVKSPIIVRDFAVQIGKKPFQVISELMELGIFASMNTGIEEDVATRIARRHGYDLEVRHRGESQTQVRKEVAVPTKPPAELKPRPPVIVILGHVDHGKTTLLDTIRKTNVVAGEAGGITQHTGAYQVEHKGKRITFIDTPGHAAFSNMRARGANVTDIAILVVAADDGFMPQTDEALSHAQRAGVPVVVALNKMDMPGANPDRVYRQLQERNLTPEEWGGEVLTAKISALKGMGIDDLLDIILLQAEVTEGIEADPKGTVEGVIMEAQKELGLGATASVIIQQGTLTANTALVCGEHYCRVRQIIDDKGNRLKQAGPGDPVKITGWSGTPNAGDTFVAVKNEREAKRLAEENELERKRMEAAQRSEGPRASVDDLFAAIAKTQKKAFRCIVKADVYGTAEALATSLLNIKSDKIDVEVVDTGVGDITRNDISMASAAEGAAIIAFNVDLESGVSAFAKHHGITVYQHNIIYELINQVKDAMAEMLEPERRENKIGAAEIRAIFPLGKGFVAGCMVTEGRVARDHLARLMRKDRQVAESRIGTLKRFKDDVNEVRAGFECGIALNDVNDYREGDIIEVFEILKIKPSL